MKATPTEIEELLDQRLQEADLMKFVNRDRSQFLDLQSELFVELVLNDGNVIPDVEKIVRRTADELRSQDTRLDSVVRALWEIVRVEFVGSSLTPDGGFRAASNFRAVLRSGTRECVVSVDVFLSATELLRSKLGFNGERTSLSMDLVVPLVRSLVEHQLSSGGTGYWSPLLCPSLELNEPAMSFLLGQSSAFEELRQAVADAFDPPVVESFIKSLAVSRIRIDNFDAVLPELSNMLGRAYRPSETFSTSATALFQNLRRTEQELLRAYFQQRVEWLKKKAEFQPLIQRYHLVFG
jgi:hypothetical protein